MTMIPRLAMEPALALLLAAPLALSAQERTSAAVPAVGGTGEIHGQLVDAGTREPLSGGSVAVRRVRDSAFVGGALPDAKGSFRVGGLLPGDYVVRIRVLGYAPVSRSGVVVTIERPSSDLGLIALSTVATRIEGQVVTAEREAATFAADRNTYLMKDLPTASGGTAADVLRNLPSVEVDGSSRVKLRGNENVVIQINGRSLPLKGEQLAAFLAQLPASAIKAVEVATNPSARNDPEGTAGIINVLLDQKVEGGRSGGLALGAGTTGQASLGGHFGHQSGPLTLWLSSALSRDEQETTGRSSQANIAIPIPALLESHTDGSLKPFSRNAIARVEWRPSPRDAFSADLMLSTGLNEREDASNFAARDESRDQVAQFDQYHRQRSESSVQDYVVAFRHAGETGQRTFLTQLRLTKVAIRSDADLFGVVHQGDRSTGAVIIPHERDFDTGGYPSWSLQSDVTQPLWKLVTLEAGIRGVLRHTTDSYEAVYPDSLGGGNEAVRRSAASLDYHERIAGTYAVLTQRRGKLEAQVGLRLEFSSARIGILDAPSEPVQPKQQYASWFPSGVLTYSISTTREVSLSYARRTTRPTAFQLSPVEYLHDALNVLRGNPAVRPEYTDAIEGGFREALSWGTIQLTPYVRRTSHAIRFVQTTDSSGVTLGTFDNVTSTMQMGSDLNIMRHQGALTLLVGASAYHFRSNAANLSEQLSTIADVWSAHASATLAISRTLSLQLFASYRSPVANEGGVDKSLVFTNIALRRKLWDNQGSITLRTVDPFSLTKFGSTTSNAWIVQSTERSSGMRGVFIFLTRNFGEQPSLPPRPDTEPQRLLRPDGT
jgi:outer membrane receptor protein involved in Fe transport